MTLRYGLLFERLSLQTKARVLCARHILKKRCLMKNVFLKRWQCLTQVVKIGQFQRFGFGVQWIHSVRFQDPDSKGLVAGYSSSAGERGVTLPQRGSVVRCLCNGQGCLVGWLEGC